jgi:hypothetical protein
MKCKCGKDMILVGGFVQSGISRDCYECYSCGNKFNKIIKEKIRFTNK